MKTILFFALIFVVITSCKPKSLNELAIPNGTYTGTFQRLQSARSAIAHITLQFESNAYQGTSDMVYYPAICRGSFDVKSLSKISFRDSCIWPANIWGGDLLNGDFDLKILKDGLEFSKDVGNGYKDIYKLKKQ